MFDFVSEPSVPDAIPGMMLRTKKILGIGSTLEAVAWSSLPPQTLVRRAAAFVRQQTDPVGSVDYYSGEIDIRWNGTKGAEVKALAEKLYLSGEEAERFISAVHKEVYRQRELAAKRKVNRQEPDPWSRTTKMAKRHQRLNAVASATFGRPAAGWFENPLSFRTSVGFAEYTWLRQYPPDNVVLAIAVGGKPYKTAALIYRVRGELAQSFRLPLAPKNLGQLFEVLGVKKVAGPGKVVRINWTRKAFVLNDSIIVPWLSV